MVVDYTNRKKPKRNVRLSSKSRSTEQERRHSSDVRDCDEEESINAYDSRRGGEGSSRSPKGGIRKSSGRRGIIMFFVFFIVASGFMLMKFQQAGESAQSVVPFVFGGVFFLAFAISIYNIIQRVKKAIAKAVEMLGDDVAEMYDAGDEEGAINAIMEQTGSDRVAAAQILKVSMRMRNR
jgi:hypothetical protein